MIFRLTVGTQNSRTLEHTFTHPGRYGAKQMFLLSQFDDEIVIGCEIIEVEHQVQFWDGEPGHHLDPRHKTADGPFVTVAGDVVDSKTKRIVEPGPVELYAHTTFSNRVRRQMEDELQVQRGRFVRSVEWTVQNAAETYKTHPGGRALHSTTFSAAGIPDLHLVVYPRGMGKE